MPPLLPHLVKLYTPQAETAFLPHFAVHYAILPAQYRGPEVPWELSAVGIEKELTMALYPKVPSCVTRKVPSFSANIYDV